MPNRTFRITIQNNSSATLVYDPISSPASPSVDNGPLLLKQSFNHLCQGQWTEGNWAPPATIAAGTSGALQAESNSFLGGTEGYVKYDVLANGGMTKVGMIYIYWLNPFMGITTFLPSGSFTDIYPNCDYPSNKQGQDANPGTESLPFTFGVVGEGQEGVDPALASSGDYLVFAAGLIPVVGVVAGLVDLFGTAGITAHPQLWVALNDAPLATGTPPMFGTSPQTFLKLLTNATHHQWMGTWGTGEITVTITQPAGGATLSAAVYDGTTKPALSFTQTITPGPAGLLDSAAGWVHTLVQEQAQNPAQRVALTNAATQVINEAAQAQAAHSPVQTGGLPTHFRSLVGAQNTETATAATAAVGGAIAKLLEAEGGVAYLENNVVLSLYGVFEVNGTQIGTQLQYQRFTAAGSPVSSAMLSLAQYIG